MAHRIIVFGATGKSGVPIVEQATAAGHQVTGFVRNPAKAARFPRDVRIVKGDVLNAQDVADAMSGHDVAISVLGTSGTRAEPVCAQGIVNIIAAMKAHHVGRLIALSAYGTADSRHGWFGWVLNTLMPAVQRDKEAMERAIAASDLDWTIVRPPGLSRGSQTGRIKADSGLVLSGFRRLSRADLAAWMIEEVEARKYVRQMPVIGPA